MADNVQAEETPFVRRRVVVGLSEMSVLFLHLITGQESIRYGLSHVRMVECWFNIIASSWQVIFENHRPDILRLPEGDTPLQLKITGRRQGFRGDLNSPGMRITLVERDQQEEEREDG